MKEKLPVEVDGDMESLAGICFESCVAFCDGHNTVRVLGELVSTNGASIEDYREVQIIVYDADGEMIGREYTNWSTFLLRQSFEIEIEDLPCKPARTRVFPTRSD